ncbi:hypothetical protein ACWDOP_32265, partial [Nocardia sp. NPDC003693]
MTEVHTRPTTWVDVWRWDPSGFARILRILTHRNRSPPVRAGVDLGVAGIARQSQVLDVGFS